MLRLTHFRLHLLLYTFSLKGKGDFSVQKTTRQNFIANVLAVFEIVDEERKDDNNEVSRLGLPNSFILSPVSISKCLFCEEFIN